MAKGMFTSRVALAAILAAMLAATSLVMAAEPLAIVSAVKGKVEVVPARAKEAQRAVFGMALQRADRVSVGRGGAATIFFSDGNVIELGEQSSVTIGARVDKPAKPEIASEVFAQVSNFVTGGSRQTGLVALSSMRGEDAAAFLLRPRKTSVLSAQPAFLWRRIPGATRYRVQASSEAGPLWSRETSDTSLAYPSDADPLPADTDVLWEVEARSQSGQLRHETTFLHVSGAQAADRVRRHVEGIDASLGAQAVAANYLAGSYLSAAGFYLDAIGRFTALCRAMPDSPGPHEALARAYDSVGLMDLAAEEYRRALELSRSP
jgi:hypothetical protein